MTELSSTLVGYNLKIAELTAQILASDMHGKGLQDPALSSTFRTLYKTVEELVLGSKP